MSEQTVYDEYKETILEDQEGDGFDRYRTLSAPAVVSVCLGLASLGGLLFASVLVVAVIAVGVSIYAIWSIRKSSELSGGTLAMTGLGLALFSLLVGGPWHAIVYATEVPEGYERIYWHELQARAGAPENSVPPNALNLNGQKVFIKGYIHPMCPMGKIRRFVMVPNFDTCCFGGQPKITHMIDVSLRETAEPTSYAQRIKAFAGVLKVYAQPKQHAGMQGVVYELVDAECLR